MKKMIIALGVGLVFTTIYGCFFGDFISSINSGHDSLIGYLFNTIIALIIPSAVSAALLYAYRSQVVSLLKLNIDAADDEDEEDAQARRKVLFILSSIFLGVMSSSLFNAYASGSFFITLIRVVLTVVAVFGVYTLLQRSKTDSDADTDF